MRAFVALIPPAEALAELADAVRPLHEMQAGLRWAPAEQWHLTLAFLGEVDESVLPDLTERLARAARRHPPPQLALAGAGRFGDRVLWTRVVDAAPAAGPPADVPGPREFPGERPGVRESPVSTGRVARLDRARRGAGVDGLRRLAASVGAAARRSGIAVDDRPYRPHLTLARARGGTDLRPLVAALTGFAGEPWTAESLHLVHSRLGAGPGGTAAHEVVETWPLGR